MNKRSSPRLLPGPDTSMISLRKHNSEEVIRGYLLDQSVDGLALQLGRRCSVELDENIEVLVGDSWEPAIVTSAKRQGIVNRVGLRWVAGCEASSISREQVTL
ncbi:MAG: hypothetical protein H8E66_31470 [Planctomycetes bacterium]|nr:hypothetical protein [Planctomycetota bacterium]